MVDVVRKDISTRQWSVSLVSRHYWLRYAAFIFALAGAYYAAAQIGYTLKFSGAVAAIVWLPVGVGIAFLYLGGLSLWPGVLIGDLLANQYDKLPVGSAIGQSIGNVLEVVVAAALLRRLARDRRPLESVGGVCAVLVAIFCGVAVSATVGPISLRLGHVLTTSELPTVWHTWWLGDTAGALLVVPLALAWAQPFEWEWSALRVLEGALMLASVVVLSDLALRSDRPLSYIVFPALIWAALRFGPRGGTLAVAVTAAITLWKTAHHAGPFVVSSLASSTLSTQLFVAVAALSAMFLAAVVSERQAFARGLVESRARLVGAADRERRRLEQNLHDGAQVTLTMLAVHLGVARRTAMRSGGELVALLEDAETQALTAIGQLRELGHGIHPTILTDLGLAEAIRSLTDYSPIPIRVLEVPSGRFDPTAETAGYYVVSEALANAQKHASATSITIRAGRRGDRLEVDVLDDGVGGADMRRGLGLQGLRDRLEAVNGSLTVFSAPGWGTRVRAVIPVTSS
ncbi:MAG TPA: MASE1 domain-containing protein [Gaiellaceae bacterium]